MDSLRAADRKGMLRAAELALRALGNTAPNPVVGCCLIYRPGTPDERLLSEGFHARAGLPHAEAVALANLPAEFLPLLAETTAYVTLEPCAHFGKTPPCAHALVQAGIQRVVYGTLDPDPRVAGKGVEILAQHGVLVEAASPEIQSHCRWINRRFLVSVEQNRPYVVLKWAQTPEGGMDGFRTPEHPGPYAVSSLEAQAVVHQWRSEEDAIAVGARTWDLDRPQLNARLVGSKNPVRVVVGTPVSDVPEDVLLVSSPDEMLKALHGRGIRSVLVEGGPSLLRSFLEQNLWDEVRILTQERTWTPSVYAPHVPDDALVLDDETQRRLDFPGTMGQTTCRIYLPTKTANSFF
jgi:diaminohydroxyphosphoribosylaminopyrimidine deaminase/5-amino-6-(5-phosphoribosylamino)uracil reductase